MQPVILWLRKTLRAEVLRGIAPDQPVVPVVVDDPRRHETSPAHAPAWGERKQAFWWQAVADLSERIAGSGGGLIVERDRFPEEVIPAIADRYDAETVYLPAEDAWFEHENESRLRETDLTIDSVRLNTLYTDDQLPFAVEKTPDTFTRFNNRVQESDAVLAEPSRETPRFATTPEAGDVIEAPSIDHDTRSSLPFRGGRTAGLDRVDAYINAGLVDSYADRRNDMYGVDYSSKLSPYLALGCISPREVYWACERYRKNVEDANDYAIDKLQFELHWREYYRWAMAKHGRRFFSPSGIQSINWSWDEDDEMFERWRQGRTGIPIVDACMRELNKTGYMSNRGRQLVASFLAHNLNLDWRWGARYMEEQLLDCDVYSNWCNWAYVAGVGTDSRKRYFNILKQAGKYDPDAKFVKEWLPQLAPLPATHAHAPWKLSHGMAEAYDVVIGEEYPEPMIDLEASYERARRRWS